MKPVFAAIQKQTICGSYRGFWPTYVRPMRKFIAEKQINDGMTGFRLCRSVR